MVLLIGDGWLCLYRWCCIGSACFVVGLRAVCKIDLGVSDLEGMVIFFVVFFLVVYFQGDLFPSWYYSSCLCFRALQGCSVPSSIFVSIDMYDF